jgi:hypothetical protein
VAHDKPQALNLPMLVVSPVDVGRLLRELETINDALLQLSLRKSGSEVKLPKTTQLMDQLITINKLNLLHEDERKQLQAFLTYVNAESPLLHISFSADPNVAFLEKLMAWLRKEIHPLILVTVGLQPNIGAGCIIRTPNRQFDLSLRQDFAEKRDLLMEKLLPVADATPAAAPVEAAAGASA